MSDIKYTIQYSRRKTISITVSPSSGVTVRAPLRTSLQSIEKLINSKSEWIKKHLIRHNELKRVSTISLSGNGSKIQYLGKEIDILISESKKRHINLVGNKIEIGINDSENYLLAKKMLEKWFKEEAIRFLGNMFYNILSNYKEYGFNPSALAFRKLKSRWGSCSSKGNITLNTELIKLNPLFAEYVIIHELCHLRHHNHGKEFYKLLRELSPDYLKIRKELRMYTTR